MKRLTLLLLLAVVGFLVMNPIPAQALAGPPTSTMTLMTADQFTPVNNPPMTAQQATYDATNTAAARNGPEAGNQSGTIQTTTNMRNDYLRPEVNLKMTPIALQAMTSSTITNQSDKTRTNDQKTATLSRNTKEATGRGGIVSTAAAIIAKNSNAENTTRHLVRTTFRT